MNTSLINWTKDDRSNLRKAVNNFNSKIKRLEALGKENLPDKVSYKDLVGIGKLTDEMLRSEIYSRRELNNVIRSLERFTKRGAEELVTLPSGEQITKWQQNEIRISKGRATRNINKRISEIDTSFGMGTEELQELEGLKQSLQDIFKSTGSAFKRKLQSLKFNASGDRELRMASMWKENYLERLKSLKNFENYDLFKDKVESFKNPIKLYEYIKQSEILNDLFLWTKTDEIVNPSSQIYGGFKSDQEAFNTALEQLGLLSD